ncbi:FecR family protein [Spirosoma luteum]|uniref:FecR family protein n=1 Tax=Spirosoma luteum TaxID=431553 RepID=UPI0003728F82|nr:FecR family protein [Spirosoma luteum]
MDLLPENATTVEDFIGNAAFRLWVTERRPKDRQLWNRWLAQNPEKRELYEQAVATFLLIQGKKITLSDQQVNDRTASILDRLPDAYIVRKPFINWQWGRWVAAAAVISLVVWWQSGNLILAPFTKTNEPVVQTPPEAEWTTVRNVTEQALVVLLPDKSSVLLSTNSQLRFRKQASHALREVYLQGDGFFEVTKDPGKPFIVYTASLTTKVLGTSFQVHSSDQDKTAYVKVKTGKVTVTPVNAPDKAVVLNVNEALKLGSTAGKGVKSADFLSDENPSAIIARPFVFSYTAVPEIFDQLEASYHMPIHYDRSLLSRCTFTGKLDGVPFLEKIQLICLAIESSYEVVDNKVVIQSLGCN